MKRIVLMALFLAWAAHPAAAESIKIGTEAAYPPFNYLDDAGNVAGYDVDVGNEICRRAALDCTWVANEWDSIIQNLIAGNYDAVMADVTITDERKQTVDFSHPYFPPDPSQYLRRAEKPVDYAKLAGYRIGVQGGTVQAAWLNVHLKDANTILSFSTTDQALADLKAGNVDVIVVEGSFVDETVMGSGGTLVTDGPKLPIGDGAGVVLRQADDALEEKVNDAIDAMRADGTIDALIARWFPEKGAAPYFAD